MLSIGKVKMMTAVVVLFLGTNETLWWTGVYDENEDGDQRYQVNAKLYN